MRFYPRFLIYFIWICSFRWELLCLALSPSSPLSPVQKHPFQTESGFRMLNLSQSQFTADSVFPVLVGHGLTIDSNFFSSGKKTIETSGEEVHLKNLHYSSLFPSAIGWIKTTWVPTERICSQCLKISCSSILSAISGLFYPVRSTYLICEPWLFSSDWHLPSPSKVPVAWCSLFS